MPHPGERGLPRALTVAGILAGAAALGAPVASAHCDGIEGKLLGIVDKCLLQEGIEAVVDQLNQASDGRMAFVLAKDFRFHPEVASVRSGGTVVFLYADIHSNQLHDPRSGGPCRSAAADPVADPQTCAPTVPAKCFDVALDEGAFLGDLGDAYPVAFRYAAADGVVAKSYGLLQDAPAPAPVGGEPFQDCPPGSSLNAPARAVIPYHCGIHGAASSFIRDMRGAIVVEA